jgi:glycosyltransferase involved in cell wall biosynthesis
VKTTHLTTVHSRSDVRIFYKMCCSLANAGHETTMIVSDGKGQQNTCGVNIIDIGSSKNRLDRMLNASRRMLRAALDVNADIYHLHDPELLWVALKLKRRGKRVIFDAHEDVQKQILSKDYLWINSRKSISYAYGIYQKYCCRRLDGVVGATPSIHEMLKSFSHNTVLLSNYPLPDEIFTATCWKDKLQEVCFIGGLTEGRGAFQVVDALANAKSDVKLNFAGSFSTPALRDALIAKPSWKHVTEWGWLSRSDVRAVLARSRIGIVTFLPEPNHTEALPNKIFEYMSAGIPVIASNFPLWRQIVEGCAAGICVDPTRPEEIALAIDALLLDTERAREYGENGRRAVQEQYNWSSEELKLLNFYTQILIGSADRGE